MLQLHSIFRNTAVKASVSFCDIKHPNVSYLLGDTIGHKLYNFKGAVTSYDCNKPIDQYPCICSDPFYQAFIHKDTGGHVATGDFNVINEPKLQSLFNKGPNYREPVTVDWEKLQTSVFEDLTDFIETWSKKSKIAVGCFNEWLSIVKDMIKVRIDKLKVRYVFPKYTSVFSDPQCSAILKKLKENFILVPVDKAPRNIAIICKRFYMTVLINEINTNITTYSNIDTNIEDPFTIQLDYMKNSTRLYNTSSSLTCIGYLSSIRQC